jgi:prepilin-type processing-associated H-X9-DG protein
MLARQIDSRSSHGNGGEHRFPRRRGSNTGLTLVEVLVVIGVMVLLVGLLLPWLARNNHSASRISCTNNLKQIGLAVRLFAVDNGDKFPWKLSNSAGGSLECVSAPSQAFRHFLVMSNELSTPKILHCPEDKRRGPSIDWLTLNNANLSYFIGLDASETYPQLILAGDSNLMTNRVPVGSGLLLLTTNVSLGWTTARHQGSGNISLGDGSVQQITSIRLQQHLAGSNVGTNRIVIP